MKPFSSLIRARQWCLEVQASAPVAVLVRKRAYVVQVLRTGFSQKTGFMWSPLTKEVTK